MTSTACRRPPGPGPLWRKRNAGRSTSPATILGSLACLAVVIAAVALVTDGNSPQPDTGPPAAAKLTMGPGTVETK